MTAIRFSTYCRAVTRYHAIEEAKTHQGWRQPGQGSDREPREEQSAADLHSKMNRGIAVLTQVQQQIVLCNSSTRGTDALAEPYHASACRPCQASYGGWHLHRRVLLAKPSSGPLRQPPPQLRVCSEV